MQLHRPITLNIGALLLCSTLFAGAAVPSATFRSDRVPLGGTWKFQLRRDNQLCQPGPVRFGPVSASSQALFLEPWKGQSQDGRWRTSTPWPLSATLTAANRAAFMPPDRQSWRPHKEQQGATLWQADLGQEQTIAAVNVAESGQGVE